MAQLEVIGWYEEHDRSTDNDGRLVNPVTGEITYPPSMTKQEFVQECDINNIIREYQMTGMVTHISAMAAKGSYEDLPASVDFQEAIHTVMAAEAAFMTLPSKIRDRFNNDPEHFLAFCGDPGNAAELVELGLANRPSPPQEAPPEPVKPQEGSSS